MKPFEQFLPRQKLFRQKLIRLIIYGSLALLYWSMFEVVERQEQSNTSALHVEDVMMGFYRTHRAQTDTAGMATT